MGFNMTEHDQHLGNDNGSRATERSAQTEVDTLCRQIRLDCIDLLHRPKAELVLNRFERAIVIAFTFGTRPFWEKIFRLYSELGLPKELRLSFQEHSTYRVFSGAVEASDGKKKYITVSSRGTSLPEESKAIEIVMYHEEDMGFSICRIYKTPGYNYYHDYNVIPIGRAALGMDSICERKAELKDAAEIKQYLYQLKTQ